jgi:type VI secretion system protein ImpA
MASPPLLDFDGLLAPISGDDPAGSSVSFAVKEQLEEARKEDDPDSYAPDDPMRPQNPRKADWPAIMRLAQETLLGTSKDLLVAARLTEALTHVHGFAGLRDGLHLLRSMVDQCWDRMYPSIADGDLEVRAAPFYWLNDADRGARFPHTVRALPVVQTEGRHFGWQDWKKSLDGKDGTTRQEFENAVLSTPADYCRTIAAELSQALEELSGLGRSLQQRLESDAPGMTELRSALEDSHRLVQQILQRKGGAGDNGSPEASQADSGGTGAAAARPAATRAEIYQQLHRLAGRLQELEPHSPIPYLLQRAVELGAMPFPQLMRALIREAGVVRELSRELGLKDAPPAD